MPILSTCLSTSRPSPPTHGDILLEEDTDRIIMYDENAVAWKQFGPASFTYTAGGSGQLHYSGGKWADSTNANYISSSPVFHYDASQPGGSTSPALSPAHAAAVPTWGDLSGNGNDAYQPSVSSQPSYDLDISNTISGGTNVRPALKITGDTYPAPAATAPNFTHSTVFYVLCAQSNSLTSPFGSYARWYRVNGNSTVRAYGKTLTDPNFGGATELVYPSLANGPTLQIARSKAGNVEVWNAEIGGSPIATGSGGTPESTSTWITIGHTYTQYLWEIVLFNDDISMVDINKVKDYLQVKYGAFANIASSSPALTT